MLKILNRNNSFFLNVLGESVDSSSDRTFYNNKLLRLGADASINSIRNTEVYEYKPQFLDQINFNIFFLKFFQDFELEEILPFMEPQFDGHLEQTKFLLGLVDELGNPLEKGFNNVFETRQVNTLRETEILDQTGKTPIKILNDKPYFVRDKIGESVLLKPSQSGLPVFYNSFTIPFWAKKDVWINNNLLYSNLPFFRNSFLLIEYFDTPSIVNQQRIKSVPIFINNRYNITEKNRTNAFHYERPCFKLTEGVDGFNFLFLDNYLTSEFYARFSFWDALSGVKIPLIPSSELEKNRKWLQNSDKYTEASRYLKYQLNYDKKTYRIYEYNSKTKTFDQEKNNFDLYQFSFDNFFSGFVVPNNKPVSSTSTNVQTQQVQNPLNFDIINLFTETFSGVNGEPFNNNTINESDTFLNQTSKFLTAYNNYNTGSGVNKVANFPISTATIPVIDRQVNSFNKTVKNFSIKNIDNKIWRIKNLELENVVVKARGEQYDNTVYNQVKSNWNEKNKKRIAESLTVFNIAPPITETPYNFTKKIFQTTDYFELLLTEIERNRYFYKLDEEINVPNVTDLMKGPIPEFLDYCFSVLKVGYSKRNQYYVAFAEALVENQIDFNYNQSEIVDFIPKLFEAFNKLKVDNVKLYTEIKNRCADLIESLLQLGEYDTRLVTSVVNYVYKNFNPSLNFNPTYDSNKSQSNLFNLAFNINKDPKIIGYEPREYTVETLIIQDGDDNLISDQAKNFELQFLIGEKIKNIFTGEDDITISGFVKINIIDDNADSKTISIPLNIIIKPGN